MLSARSLTIADTGRRFMVPWGIAALVACSIPAAAVVAADALETTIQEHRITDALAEAAEATLAQAEVAVAHARAEKALWTTAFDALQQARSSRNRAEFAASISWSQRAIELCGLSIGQLAYPPEKP